MVWAFDFVGLFAAWLCICLLRCGLDTGVLWFYCLFLFVFVLVFVAGVLFVCF